MRWWAIPVLLALAVAPGSARAQAKLDPAAQTHLDAALKAYEVKDYDAAIREFEQAYAIDPKPALLYATAQAYRFANRCGKALELYRRYLTVKLTDSQITAAKTGISLCEAGTKESEPAAEPPRVESPQQPEPETREPAPVSGAALHDTPWYKDPIGDVLTAAGVVGIATGATFLVMASSSERAAKSATLRTDFVRSLDEATQRRRIGAVSLGVGSALAVGGVLVYLLRDRHAPRQVVSTDGRSLYISGIF
jgi:tetratricopeptide (TPR) repeat protein